MLGEDPAASETEEILVRPAKATDLNFILSGWKKSYRIGDLCAGVGNDRYYEAQHKIIAVLLQRATTLIACDAAAPDVDLGFVCAEVLPGAERVLHYVYVKDDFRRHGICNMLIAGLDEMEPAERTTCTHRTRKGKALMQKRGWTYDPYVLWATLPAHWDTTVGDPRPLIP